MARDHQSFKDALADCRSAFSDWEKQAKEDYKFFSLEQWRREDVEALREEGRPALVFDRLRPLVQAVLGSQIAQRYQVAYLPREPELEAPDRQVSNDATESARYFQSFGNFEQIESLAFQDDLVTGVGCLQLYVDFENNPDGEFLLKRHTPGSVLWDPTSRAPNMLDAGWVIAKSWVDRKEAAQLYGARAAEAILAQTAADEGQVVSIHETRPTYSLFGPSDGPAYDRKRDRIRLYERQCFERRYATRIFATDVQNPQAVLQAVQMGQPPPRLDMLVEKRKAQETVQQLQLASDALNFQIAQSLAGPIQPPVTIENFPVREYYRTIHTDREQIYEEVMKNPFNYLFITCFEDWRDPELRQFFGLVRVARDPQSFSNKMMSQGAHIFNSNPKGALLFEPNFFENNTLAAQEWAKATGMIPVKDGALSNSQAPKFQVVTAGASLSQAETLLQYAQGAVPASLGISESSFLGASGDIRRVSGEAVNSLLQQQQKTQVLPFDSLRLYRKQLGRLLLHYMSQYMTEETAVRILGQPSPQFMQGLKDGTLVEEYDVVVEEEPVSPNEKREVFKTLMDSGFLQQLMTSGIPIPPDLADYFPIPTAAAVQFKQSLQLAYEVQTKSMALQSRDLDVRMQMPPGSPLPGEMPPEGAAPPGAEGAPPEGGAPPEQAPPQLAEGVG